MSKKLLKFAGAGIAALSVGVGIGIVVKNMRKKITESPFVRRVYTPNTPSHPWRSVDRPDTEEGVVHLIKIDPSRLNSPTPSPSEELPNETLNSSNWPEAETTDTESIDQSQHPFLARGIEDND